MFSGLLDVASVPVRGVLATWAPLTYIRSVVPSYVVARCDQVLAGSADGPTSPTSDFSRRYVLGRPALSLEYSE